MMSVSRSFTQLDSAMIGMTIPTNNAALNLHTFDITGLLLKGNKRASKPEATVTGFRSSDRSVTSLETYTYLAEVNLVMQRAAYPWGSVTDTFSRLAAHPILGQKSNTFSARCNRKAEKTHEFFRRKLAGLTPSP